MFHLRGSSLTSFVSIARLEQLYSKDYLNIDFKRLTPSKLAHLGYVRTDLGGRFFRPSRVLTGTVLLSQTRTITLCVMPVNLAICLVDIPSIFLICRKSSFLFSFSIV